MSGDEHVFRQALANLHFVQSRFCLKINELKALIRLLTNAVARSQVTQDQHDKLKAELENLTSLRQESETSRSEFHAKFSADHFMEAIDIYKSIDENLTVAFDIQVDGEILLQNVYSQVAREDKRRHARNKDHSQARATPDKARKVVEEELADSQIVQDRDNHEEKVESPEETKRIFSLKLMVPVSVVLVIGFYFCLGAIIQHVQDNRRENDLAMTRGSIVEQDNKTCGADSFMLRDGVCDETANIEKCLFDGGDCCKENKDIGLCRNCTCILSVDRKELEDQMNGLAVKPVEDPMAIENEAWTIEVEDVASVQVCTIVCLDHEKNDELNTWLYIKDERVCKCGWVESTFCPEKIVIVDWTWKDNQSMAFIQLNQTVSCDCLAAGLLLTADGSDEALVEYANDFPSTHSLWHCCELCRLFQDCVWVSWKSQNDHISGGECKMMKQLPMSSSISEFSEVDPSWTSSSKDCATIGRHYERYTTSGDHYDFVCPTGKPTTSHNIQHETIKEDGEEQSNHFLIYIDGWTQSRVIVLKLDQEDSSVTECAHTLIPPENRLIRSTGGILFIPGTAGENHDIPIAVVCGGEFGLYISASSNNVPNKHCMILNKHKPPANAIARTSSSLSMAFQLSAGGTGSLNTQRLGAASVVVDGGRTLWVTSGSGQGTSEFVSISENPDINRLPTNGLGPAFSLSDHCLEKISPGVAVLIGGKNSESAPPIDNSWSFNLAEMDWTSCPDLGTARVEHACGVLRHGNDRMIVVAGGLDSHNTKLDKVETLLLTTDTDSVLQFANDWEYGPTLPAALSGTASATTSDQKALYIIGGVMVNEDSRSVLKFHCYDIVEQHCSWSAVDYELKAPSAKGLALIMPLTPMSSREYSFARDCTKEVLDDESILLVTTGFNDYHAIGDTEAYVLVSSTFADDQHSLIRCKPLPDQPQSMYALEHATGAVLRGHQPPFVYMPIVCGGLTNEGIPNYNCYNLVGGGYNIPTVAGTMTEGREGAASISLLDATMLWVTGGISVGVTDTTEWLDVSKVESNNGLDNNSILSQGIPLPMPMAFHCLERISDKTVILYGGTEHISKMNGFDSAWTLKVGEDFKSNDDSSQSWTPRASMNHARCQHNCGVIKIVPNEGTTSITKLVVAAGGLVEGDNSGSNIVELLQIEEATEGSGQITYSDSWELGPSMPKTVWAASSVTTKDQTILFVAGGQYRLLDNERSKDIYMFRCLSANYCWWTKEDVTLSFERIHSVSLITPPREQANEAEVTEYECNPDLIADGHCDTLNNNAKCGFDGGDCLGLQEGNCNSQVDCAGDLVCGVSNCDHTSDKYDEADNCCTDADNFQCFGQEDCCSDNLWLGLKCGLGQGDCDSDTECEEGLVCGSNNCDMTKPMFDAGDDCCRAMAIYSLGEGSCLSDQECADGLVCAKNNCDHTSIKYDKTDDCCTDAENFACYGQTGCCTENLEFGFKCGVGQGDCDRDDECQDGLVCEKDKCDMTTSMFDHSDDCCRVFTIHGLGEGNCVSDLECEGDLICAIDNGCELESGKYGLKDNCCVNLEDFICDGGGECCSDLFDRGLRCGLGEGDCDYDHECEDGLICRRSTCDVTKPRFSPDDACCVPWD